MSSIQQGIQAAHTQMELVLKYKDNDENNKQKIELFDWASFHKTMICLNAGMDTNLKEILSIMESPENKFAWAKFRESKDAMDGMLTNIAIVLPEQIYNLASDIRSRKAQITEDFEAVTIPVQDGGAYYVPQHIMKVTQFEVDLINILNSCGLAR